MLEYLILGSGYAFAAAIQPGPLQAFLVSRVAANGWRRTLPASVAPLLSDGPIAVIALLILSRLPPRAYDLLQAAGGVLLIYFGWSAFRQWRNPNRVALPESAPRTIFEAALVNLLNPNPYIGWTLILGPAALAAWGERPIYALVLIVAFYGTMVMGLAGFILVVGTAQFLGSKAQRTLLAISGVLLAGLGIYLLASAIWRLGVG